MSAELICPTDNEIGASDRLSGPHPVWELFVNGKLGNDNYPAKRHKIPLLSALTTPEVQKDTTFNVVTGNLESYNETFRHLLPKNFEYIEDYLGYLSEKTTPFVIDMMSSGQPLFNLIRKGYYFKGHSVGLNDYLLPYARNTLSESGIEHYNLDINNDQYWNLLHRQSLQNGGISLLMFRPLRGLQYFNLDYQVIQNRLQRVWRMLAPEGIMLVEYTYFNQTLIKLMVDHVVPLLSKKNDRLEAKATYTGFSLRKLW